MPTDWGGTFATEGKTMTAGNASSASAEADTAIRAVFDDAVAAWAKGDTEAFVSCYAEGATVILPGIYLPNRDGIRAAMGAAFAGPLKNSRRVHEVQNIRFLTPDTAIAITKSVTVLSGADVPPAELWEWSTWVLAQHFGQWLFETCHASPPNRRPLYR
ncbi:SgcJ/EcaC family oxidoreductase [Nocardia sp. NPDC052278]|uniref:SgcJ/EcaC family oxidoreductase n=1 Tax=unclassified Nocardia TaxID=2637762 RepID=UPI0036A4BC78